MERNPGTNIGINVSEPMMQNVIIAVIIPCKTFWQKTWQIATVNISITMLKSDTEECHVKECNGTPAGEEAVKSYMTGLTVSPL